VKDFDRAVREKLEEAGWRYKRHGKHDVWYDPKTNKRVIVPVNIKSRHTANGILKDAGLGKGFA
jgi:predicted RNA binding protein YcfA (HicA-like mRNA interferase family)